MCRSYTHSSISTHLPTRSPPVKLYQTPRGLAPPELHAAGFTALEKHWSFSSTSKLQLQNFRVKPGTLEQYWTVKCLLNSIKIKSELSFVSWNSMNFKLVETYKFEESSIFHVFHRLLSRDFGGIETLQRGLNILPSCQVICVVSWWGWICGCIFCQSFLGIGINEQWWTNVANHPKHSSWISLIQTLKPTLIASPDPSWPSW